MSFIRNPKRFDVNKSRNSKISKSDVKSHLSNLDDILSSHRYYNRKAKKALESELETIAYLLDHPKCNMRDKSKLKILAETQRKVKKVKGIDTSCLKDVVPAKI